MATYNEETKKYDYTQLPVLSKIKIGEGTYYLKDKEVRELIDTFGKAVNYNVDTEVKDKSSNLITSGAVHAYVTDYVTEITGGAMTFVGIFAAEENKTHEEVLAEKVPAPAPGYVAIVGTAEYVYADGKWNLYGDEGVYATIAGVDEAYVKKSLTIAGIDLKDNISAEELTAALTLGALAHKNSATGTVAGQTISGVKATGTTTGSIAVALEATEKEVASTGKYTPAGTVSGTATTAGSIEVTLNHEGTAATLSKGDYTPAGTISANFSHDTVDAQLVPGTHTPAGSVDVTVSGATFNAITSEGTAASFTEGKFTAPELKYDPIVVSTPSAALVGEVDDDDECLTFSNPAPATFNVSAITKWEAGSKEADTWVPNTPAAMAPHTIGASATFTGEQHDTIVGVKYDKAALNELTFTGTKAEGALITGVTYDKAAIGTQKFNGQTVDIAATFAGTEGDINVAGKANDYAVKTAEFTGAAIELAVGDIAVAEKTVTVQ